MHRTYVKQNLIQIGINHKIYSNLFKKLILSEARGEGLGGMSGKGDGLGTPKSGPSGTGMSMGQNYSYVTDPTFGHQIRTFQSY